MRAEAVLLLLLLGEQWAAANDCGGPWQHVPRWHACGQ